MFLLPRSLRARMLWSLLAVILFGAVIQGAIAYRTALQEANQLFDYNMQQMALSMRSGIPLVSPAGLPELDDNLNGFDFVVQVWTSEGIRIFESSPSLILPQRAVLGFSDVDTSRARYRVYSIQTPTRAIQVAQDLAVRKRLAGGLALRTVAPIAMIVPLLMLVTWWVVTQSLAPVARVRGQVASRAADDLSPVNEEGLPDEVRPLVQELNLLLDRLRTAFEAQRNFVADAAHELRSPLAALSLQVQTLRRAGDDEGREVAAARLAAGIDRASRLIEQLLMLARQEASAAAGAKVEEVDLRDVAREGIGEMTGLAHERGIDLGLAPDAPPARVAGHSEALLILLRNLIDNALKYTPAGGTVDVAIQLGRRLSLVVEDSGPGIGPPARERALARFDRLGGGSPGVPGSGLGLAIVKTIADRHRAELKLDRSERLGGLKVEVVFPDAGRRPQRAALPTP
ncbi:MAG: sensor histidine kinase N-terminal domain-containing protein [Lautropia sp.]|nr:sensor histidine kinase N-terminal domain-containing protein [Lautropia sp.]